MKFENLIKYVTFVTIVFSVLVLDGEAFAGKWENHCLARKCLNDKSELVKLGYDPSVAERISIYRPDLSYLITSPEVLVHPEDFMRTTVSESLTWFESQVQDRTPITVYRGMTFPRDKIEYDPTYFFKGELPVIDPRLFTSDKLETALGYAVGHRQGKKGLLLRMQIPRFMLYEKKPGPYGLVYFRDLVPNDLLFVNGVAFISPELRIDYSEEVPPQLDRISKTLVFESLENSYRKVSKIPLTREERIGPDGRFVPTQSWTDSYCSITSHPSFKLLLSEISETADLEKFMSAFGALKSECDEEGEVLLREQANVEQARQILLQLPVKEPPDSGPVEEFLLAWVIGSTHQCLNARSMWLQLRTGQIERSRTEASFLSTYKALHGISSASTPESKLIRRLIESQQQLKSTMQK